MTATLARCFLDKFLSKAKEEQLYAYSFSVLLMREKFDFRLIDTVTGDVASYTVYQ